jgi:transposase
MGVFAKAKPVQGRRGEIRRPVVPVFQDVFRLRASVSCRCQHVQEMPLSERTYVCPECGLEMNRDLNAARNVAAHAVRPTGGEKPAAGICRTQMPCRRWPSVGSRWVKP